MTRTFEERHTPKICPWTPTLAVFFFYVCVSSGSRRGAEIAERMKRYQKLLGPIVLGLCVWGVVLGYCAKSGECREPVRDVIEAVSAAGLHRTSWGENSVATAACCTFGSELARPCCCWLRRLRFVYSSKLQSHAAAPLQVDHWCVAPWFCNESNRSRLLRQPAGRRTNL